MSGKKLLIPLGIFIVFSIVGTWIVYKAFQLEPKAFGTELAKALIQVATVLALGQLVSMWVEEQRQKREEENKARDKERERVEKELEQERQRAEQEVERRRQHVRTMNELRKELLTRLTTAYSDAKKIRRLTRAKSLFVVRDNRGADVVHVNRGVYDELMESLNDIQLTLELILREIVTSRKTSSEVFSTPYPLQRNVAYMEGYLRKIIREYETRLKDFKGDPPSLELRELARLSEFVRRDDIEFNTRFVSSYKIALDSIRADILASDRDPTQI